jgi:hypothetical protein
MFFFFFYYNVSDFIRRGWADEDKLCWIPSKRRLFEGKTFYKVIIPNVGSSFPGKIIWKS